MMMKTKRYVGGHEVRPGARISQPSNLERARVSVVTVCDQIEPESWHGEVLLFNQVVVTTGPFPTDAAAARAAERSFVDRVIALLAG